MISGWSNRVDRYLVSIDQSHWAFYLSWIASLLHGPITAAELDKRLNHSKVFFRNPA